MAALTTIPVHSGAQPALTHSAPTMSCSTVFFHTASPMSIVNKKTFAELVPFTELLRNRSKQTSR